MQIGFLEVRCIHTCKETLSTDNRDSKLKFQTDQRINRESDFILERKIITLDARSLFYTAKHSMYISSTIFTRLGRSLIKDTANPLAALKQFESF